MTTRKQLRIEIEEKQIKEIIAEQEQIQLVLLEILSGRTTISPNVLKDIDEILTNNEKKLDNIIFHKVIK